MKHILIFMIKIYQKIPGPWHNKCRHIPTCSNYSIEALNTHGFFKGSFLMFKRIIKCNPWGTYGFDPVPKKEEKYEKNR